MNKDVVSFAFPGADADKLLRVVLRASEPWFVAKDVCAILDVRDTSNAVKPLDDDEKDTCLTRTLGGEQEMLVISESGLYTLVVRSRMATTAGTLPHRFRRWVFGEVIPQIRKTGRYAPGPGEGFDWDEIGEKLKLVRECRLTSGRKSAQVLWLELGLPTGQAPERRREQASNGIGFVQSFLDEMTEESPSGQVQSSVLYDAWRSWAKANDAPSMTQAMFGRTLGALEVPKRGGHVIHYLGFRLKHRSEVEG